MRTFRLLLLSAAAAAVAATTAFAVGTDPTIPSAVAGRSVVTTQAGELPGTTEVQAAQADEVTEAVVVEATTPRPLLAAAAPDGDVAFVPEMPAPAPQPEPAPEPEPGSEPASSSSAWSGVASWYGAAFAGQSTASGETFDPGALTAAHRTLPFGAQVRVTLEATGQSVVVRINDRGPYSGGREIDLSRAAAAAIGLTARGTGQVTLEVV